MSCTGFGRTIDAMRSYLIVVLHLLVSMRASSAAGGGVMGRFADVIIRMLTSTCACACVYSRLSREHDFVFDIAECGTTKNLMMRQDRTNLHVVTYHETMRLGN
jgi:hypothetical protein